MSPPQQQPFLDILIRNGITIQSIVGLIVTSEFRTSSTKKSWCHQIFLYIPIKPLNCNFNYIKIRLCKESNQ